MWLELRRRQGCRGEAVAERKREVLAFFEVEQLFHLKQLELEQQECARASGVRDLR